MPIVTKDKIKWPGGTFSFGYLMSVFMILLLFSVVTIISAIGTYRISVEGSKNLLETRAVDIAVNLGFAIEKIGIRNELLSELVESDRWDDLAYLVLYDQNSTVLLHSNPLLVGRHQEDPHIKRVILKERPETHFLRLATGERVFVLDFPLHLHIPIGHTDKRAHGSKRIKTVANSKVYCLRVSLHPYPAEAILRKANLQFASIGLSLILLWLLTFFLFRAWHKNYRLETRLHEQERMAALGEMAAVLAHEIRNPLSSIKGFAQIHLEETVDPELGKDLSIIVEESRRLERLTSNLLTYARPIELNEEKFDMKKFCQEIERSIIPLTGKITFHISCEKSHLFLDREKLKQVVFNLVQNALDAVRDTEQGEVWVKAKSSETQLTVTVEDNGPGLPPEIKDQIFEPFVTSKAKGVGLGLAIVHRLIEGMGGKITFNGREDGGILVKVIVPLFRSQMDSKQELIDLE
ncbi:MAG: GHKL domain-containing protein [Nitrospiraceae bacterium]|nr:GHKL domain-containing protein [Nitrospiraceae bacterium]